MSIINRAIVSIVNYKMVSTGKRAMKQLHEDTLSPMSVQESYLLRVLSDNKDTEFGKRYDFASIKSIEEFQRRVPVSSYDDYAPDIERMAMNGETNVLTTYPIKHYSKSSGTMGNPKYIPYSERTAERAFVYNLPYLYAMWSENNLLGLNKGVNLVESVLTILPSKATYGAYSARVITENQALFERINTPPVDVMIPKERMNGRYLQAFFALKEADLSFGLCAFYSYFLEILRYIEKEWEMLADDIERGSFDDSIEIAEDVKASLLKKITPDKRRADQIREIFRDPIQPLVPKIWPKFKVLGGIGTAGFSTYTEKLKIYFGSDVHFYMLGLIASEGLFSVPIRIDCGESTLIPNNIFYEFMPEGADDYNNLLTLDKLEEGQKYELVLTNMSGLYRYKMRDVVRVVGRYNNTPTIEFCYRADETVNLVGEKTTEYALREVVKRAAEECRLETVDYCMYPNADAVPVRYEFLIEPTSYLPDDFDVSALRDAIDRNLSVANPSMGDKLKKGVVGESAVYMLQEETCLLYRDIMTLRGASSAQLKPARILNNPWRRDFFYRLIDQRFKKN